MKTSSFIFPRIFIGVPFSSLIIFMIACITLNSCKRDEDIASTHEYTALPPSPANLGASRLVDVMGVVTDENGNPVSGALVRAGYSSQSFTTDERGYFELRDIVGYEDLALVRVNKQGYFSGSRSFIPTDGMNKVRIALLAENTAGSFSSESGGTVSLENVTIQFPPNAVSFNGNAYSGSVSVSINYINPSNSTTMYNEMPGNLYGLRDGELALLKSYGMAGVELHDAQGNLLQLSEGVTADIQFTIPSSLLSTAPDEIALWHYSEELGYWIQEGVALLSGDHYAAEVSHFSFWNCDDPFPICQFTCTLYDATHSAPGATPLSGVLVEIVSENSGSGSGITDGNGMVSGLVPLNELLVLNVYLECGGTSTLVYSQVVGPFSADVTGSVNIMELLTPVSSVSGTLQNSTGDLVPGVVFINDWDFVYTDNGYYSMMVCTDYGEVEGWYMNDGEYCYSEPIATSFIEDNYEITIVCNSCSELVVEGEPATGNDGEQYPTVIIGNQEWFAINLRSASYANGDPITEITGASEWVSPTEGAWCYYANIPENDAVYGKLYNWLTTVDPRNVCPTGYRVPTDDDWNELRSYVNIFLLDSALFGGALKSTGTIEQGDGEWYSPNTYATNVTLFNALPGGSRFSGGGFFGEGFNGNWWSQTTMGANSARFIRLSSGNGSIMHSTAPEENGFSIRCMRDL